MDVWQGSILYLEGDREKAMEQKDVESIMKDLLVGPTGNWLMSEETLFKMANEIRGTHMTDSEKQILSALISVIEEYMPCKNGKYEHKCMQAPNDALEVLEKFGLAEDDGWHIVPTEKWKGLL